MLESDWLDFNPVNPVILSKNQITTNPVRLLFLPDMYRSVLRFAIWDNPHPEWSHGNDPPSEVPDRPYRDCPDPNHVKGWRVQ